MTKLIETIYFDPPLPPAKEVQIINHCGKYREVAILCSIIDSISSYSNFEKDELGPSQMLAFIPSQHFPSVKMQKSKDPINSIKFIIMNEKRGDPIRINKLRPLCVTLFKDLSLN